MISTLHKQLGDGLTHKRPRLFDLNITKLGTSVVSMVCICVFFVQIVQIKWRVNFVHSIAASAETKSIQWHWNTKRELTSWRIPDANIYALSDSSAVWLLLHTRMMRIFLTKISASKVRVHFILGVSFAVSPRKKPPDFPLKSCVITVRCFRDKQEFMPYLGYERRTPAQHWTAV